MQGLPQLSQDEAHVLAGILAPLSKRAQYPLSLHQLLQRWGTFVAQVEKAYEGSMYEYTNELSVRDLLEEILRKVPRSLYDKLIKAVRLWDDRFQEATRSVTRPLAPGLPQDAASWWFQVPKNLSKPLQDDLRAEGIVE